MVAPAGSGKGVCLEAQRLLQPIQEEYDEAYNNALKVFKHKRHQWNIDKERATKEGRPFDLSTEPVQPKPIDFLSSDVISLSRFIEEQQNSPQGAMVFVSELASLINRGPITCLRLGAVLTALRKFEEGSTAREIAISRDDFHTALEMTRVFLRHAAQYSTILPGSRSHSKPMQPINPSESVLNGLPQQFTSAEAVAAFARAGVKRTTAYKLVGLWKENGMVTCPCKGKYEKVVEEPTPASGTPEEPQA